MLGKREGRSQCLDLRYICKDYADRIICFLKSKYSGNPRKHEMLLCKKKIKQKVKLLVKNRAYNLFRYLVLIRIIPSLTPTFSCMHPPTATCLQTLSIFWNAQIYMKSFPGSLNCKFNILPFPNHEVFWSINLIYGLSLLVLCLCWVWLIKDQQPTFVW